VLNSFEELGKVFHVRLFNKIIFSRYVLKYVLPTDFDVEGLRYFDRAKVA
jgi:hypothetical protein